MEIKKKMLNTTLKTTSVKNRSSELSKARSDGVLICLFRASFLLFKNLQLNQNFCTDCVSLGNLSLSFILFWCVVERRPQKLLYNMRASETKTRPTSKNHAKIAEM